MRHRFCITILLFCSLVKVTGQTNDKSKLLDEMKNMRQAYSEADHLSFNIRYFYSTENKPLTILDSLEGKIDLMGSNFRMVLANTETIKNDRFVINVFKDDNMLFLSKADSTSNTNPLALMDSALIAVDGLTYTIDEKSTTRLLTLTFPENYPYKKVVFSISKATGLLSGIKYLVKAEQLTLLQETQEQSGEYAVVESLFSDYKFLAPDALLFEENTYFSVQQNEYKPSEQYKNYSIFLGSPNL